MKKTPSPSRGLHRILGAGGVITAIVLLLAAIQPSAPVASTNCPQPAVDGDLSDLASWITCLTNEFQFCTGVDETIPAGDLIITNPNIIPCVPIVDNYFVNGADMTRLVASYDPEEGDLFLGMTVAGVVGDPDGNGDPDASCTASNIADEPGIGVNDDYIWYIDVNCDQVPDITVQVSGNDISVTGAAFNSASYAVDGSEIEAVVTDVALPLPFAVQGFSNEFDGLSEDATPWFKTCDPVLAIDVEKTVPDVCAGAVTLVEGYVENTGPVALSDVEVVEHLETGFTYVANSATGLGEPVLVGGTLEFPVFDLAIGERVDFTFELESPSDCSGFHTNQIDATGYYTADCIDSGSPDPNTLSATDTDVVGFQCLPGPCVQIDAPTDSTYCPGETVTFTVTATNCLPIEGGEPELIRICFDGDCDSTMVDPGDDYSRTFTGVMPGECPTQGSVFFPWEVTATNSCGPTTETGSFEAVCTEPVVDIVKLDGLTEGQCVPSDSVVTYTIYVINPGPTPLTDIAVTDDVVGPLAAYVGSSATPAGDVVAQPADGGTGTVEWSVAGPLAVGDSLEFSFQVVLSVEAECTENEVYPNTAEVDAYCGQGLAEDSVTIETCIECIPPGVACPRTIGFWRQQCKAQPGAAPKGNVKVCYEGMAYDLWPCVIQETDVESFVNNDGNTLLVSDLRLLAGDDLFDAMCDELNGPRPMSIRHMAEIQYLGLMLNVCSGALPPETHIDNGMFSGSVASLIDEIEESLNTGVDLEHWKNMADWTNNRVGVLAEDCPDPNGVVGDQPSCGDAGEPVFDGQSQGIGLTGGNIVIARAYPNPAGSARTTIAYRVPDHQDQSFVELQVYDVAGRLVRTLVQEPKSAGDYRVQWDLDAADGVRVPSGIYFYNLMVGNERVTEKLVVTR